MIFLNYIYRFKLKILNKIINKKYVVKKGIFFGSINANLLLKKLIRKSNFIFEYGSGSSTLYYHYLKKKFVSVELDADFIKNLSIKKNLLRNIEHFYIGITGEFSYPLICSRRKVQKYIQSIDKHLKNLKRIDLILIDGRFRVACCLNLLKHQDNLIKNNTKVILDDYNNRKHYHIIKKYFYVKKYGRIALLKPRNKINFHKNEFNQYLNDPR